MDKFFLLQPNICRIESLKYIGCLPSKTKLRTNCSMYGAMDIFDVNQRFTILSMHEMTYSN